MTSLIKRAEGWARKAGVSFAPYAPASVASGEGFSEDASLDFGRLVQKAPAFVLSPRTLDHVQAALRFLSAEEIPYKLRGAAHSAAGEVLIADGAVVDLRGLCAIRGSGSNADEVRVEGGAMWLPVVEHLAFLGRAPIVVTSNLRTTIAGTLSYGGFGSASHQHGLQVEGVVQATLILPNGERRSVDRRDPLLGHALCGHGQLGVLGEVTLRTVRRPWRITGQLLHWDDPQSFVADAQRIAEDGRFEHVQARAHFTPDHAITALCGRYGDALDQAAAAGLSVREKSAIQSADALVALRRELLAPWPPFGPALEFTLPLPSGLALWPEISALVQQIGRTQLPRGHAVKVLRGKSALPLSPLPGSDFALLVALRPEPATLAAAQQTEALLRPFAPRVIQAGGRIYLTSFPLATELVAAQLGPSFQTLVALKRNCDPQGLCNPGSFFGAVLPV